MKFTFTSEFQGFGSPKNTMEFEVDHIDDVLAYFQQFLKGAGYHFDGNVIIDQETWPVEEGNVIINDYLKSESEDAN